MNKRVTSVIGIHDGHNSSVAIIKDGMLVDAVQEERFTRIKNEGNFPRNALGDILHRHDIDHCGAVVAFNGHYMSYGGFSRNAVLDDYQHSKTLKKLVKVKAKGVPAIYSMYRSIKSRDRELALKEALHLAPAVVMNVEHHDAHAYAAYYGSGMRGRVLVLTCDGSGDGLCATVNVFDDGKVERIASISENDSVGRVYAFITFLMGMVPLEHEYKIMGLAPYTGAASADAARVYNKISQLFRFDKGNGGMTWRRSRGVPSMYAPGNLFDRLIYRERFDWVAAGLQLFIEEFLTEWVRNCIRATGIGRVALGGGVFMNVKANKAIYELPELDELFVFPSCGDESNSIGAAYYAAVRSGMAPLPLEGIYFGKPIDDSEVEKALSCLSMGVPVTVETPTDIEKSVAELLAAGEIVGRVKGRMEFGARALGNRSILANPSVPGVVKEINEMIKCRDFWMPFAPSVLEERTGEYFIKDKVIRSPYMMLTFDSRPEKRTKMMAALHQYDFTGRPQEIVKDWNPDYHRLVSYFGGITGDFVVLNTSYNLHGYPIVNTPSDALEVFNASGLKNLALGSFLIRKKQV